MASVPQNPELRRVLTLWPLIFYGLEVIVGAGIYVAIGAVLERAGAAAPLSFLIAGVAAAATGLCYAELAGRFPEAAGAVAYVRHGLGSDRLALAVGIVLTLSVAVAAASIARGAVHYIATVLPLPAAILIALQVVLFSGIAAFGVRTSVGLAAALGLAEIAGLIAATAAGFLAAPEFHLDGIVPVSMAGWHAAIAGAFIAFFAFIGFETIANLAEEAKDPRRTVPRGIVGAVTAAILIYVVVTAAAVLADSPAENPLLGLFTGWSLTVFAVIAGVAVSNGVLVEIVTVARLLYGMARRGQLPAVLARVHPLTQTPVPATLAAGGIILAMALLVPFEHLLVVANAATLAVFAIVDLALWRVKLVDRHPVPSMTVPLWLPPCAAAISLGLIGVEMLG
jgi:basic amino acid/polyamine antiporter, APA family